ncbi:hypothetical protein ABPG75_005621 [Micractinium tetrahymenae]
MEAHLRTISRLLPAGSNDLTVAAAQELQAAFAAVGTRITDLTASTNAFPSGGSAARELAQLLRALARHSNRSAALTERFIDVSTTASPATPADKLTLGLAMIGLGAASGAVLSGLEALEGRPEPWGLASQDSARLLHWLAAMPPANIACLCNVLAASSGGADLGGLDELPVVPAATSIRYFLQHICTRASLPQYATA